MEEDVVAHVIRDFFTTADGELSLIKGDIVQVLEKVDKYWCNVLSCEKRGNVPTNCLIPIDTPLIEDGQQLFVARANFNSAETGDLSFSKGELIVGLKEVDANWWHGMIEQRVGIFPVNYVWQLDPSHLKAKGKQKCLNLEARVKMNMKAKLEDEMDLYLGDIVTITEIIDKQWYRGVCGTRSGTFPAGYVEILTTSNTPSDVPDTAMSTVSNKADTPPMISFSPEKEFKSPTNATDDLKDVFTDDYFRRNMPTMYKEEVPPQVVMENQYNNGSSHAMAYESQSLLDLDIVPYGISLYPFYEQFENELSFNEGEIINLIRHIDQFWMEGKIDGKKGIFPTNYINILVDCEEQPSMVCDVETEIPENQAFIPNSFAVVLYNFDAQMNSDLSVVKDQVVLVSETNGEWCQVKDRSGKVGLCPRNHLTAYSMAGDRKSIGGHESESAIASGAKLQRSLSVIQPRCLPAPIVMEEPPGERRISLDRVPHRPAPPAPVPGHKPVRRVLPRQSPCSPVAEEKEACSSQSPDSPIDVETDLQECRKKKSEHRQNVISELVFTEKEYVRDLKITYETFNLYNPDMLIGRGVDVKAVFGNLLEVMQEAETLLDMLQLAMKGKSEDKQLIGPCFIQTAHRLRNVYGQYCMNHDHALALLERYENCPEIQSIFEKGLETLRHQIACFNMGSILIKPVQRILKYPLILNELIKCTDQDHADFPVLVEAVQTMTQVATYINECKRRKDIVNKYLEDGNATISSKMSRLSLHSVAKKSSRLGVLLTSSLGFGNITKDPVFDEHETLFYSTVKTISSFVRNVDLLLTCLHEEVLMEVDIAECIAHFYQDANPLVEQFHAIQRIINNSYWPQFKLMVASRVETPLNTLLELCQGPSLLAQKRHDKLLDYDGCLAKAEKNKENRLIHEELSAAKNNYEALNNHLLEELPQLTQLASELFMDCLAAFVTARKLFCGKITKQYLALLEKPAVAFSQGDVLEGFALRHNLVINQFARFSFSSKNSKVDTLSKRSNPSRTNWPPNASVARVVATTSQVQSAGQRAYLQSKYSPDMLFTAVHSYVGNEPLHLSVSNGHMVAVIKKQNPMGDAALWFVDDGVAQGFIPNRCLEALFSNNATPPSSIVQTRVPKPSCISQPGAHGGQLGTRNTSQLGESGTVQPMSISTKNVAVSELPPSYEEVVDHSAQMSDTHLYSEIPEETAPPATEFYYALYDFLAGGGQPVLGLKSGQVVSVIHKQDQQGNSEWWFVEDRFGKQGYVPANFLNKYN